MWNAYEKWPRLKNALRMRDIDPDAINLDKLATVLEKRGITDTQLNEVVWLLISTLEPPRCPMTHCQSYGNSTSPMNCAAGKMPGRCPTLKAYKQRKKEREARATEAQTKEA